MSHLQAFTQQYDFELDDYQLDSCRALEDGSSVLVAAPTGAGKTIVGEFAVWLAVQEGKKCFYTTPIKALSNQKFHEFSQRLGADSVGLLTGDTSINAGADIVVMTTEVLRNMVYASSAALRNLGYVVLDEVHYLADKFRGAVWEEVILGLAPSVALVSLSATVSNVEEFGAWLNEVRSNTRVIVSERRPVPLFQHVIVGRRLVDLWAANPKDAKASNKASRQVNTELLKIRRDESTSVRDDSLRPRGYSGRGRKSVRHGSGAFGGGSSPWFAREKHAPSRFDIVKTLQRASLLPAICFIFSRQGCDAAVAQVGDVTLTTPAERATLAEIAQRHVEELGPEDLRVLRYLEFEQALLNGVAAHHAGVLPRFKSIIEEAFASGALKMVFATETLALGINMPARCVVIEKLVKYNGEAHADITPGEYTQLTGRAGRRGIDVEGHAVVAWRSGMDPRAVAGLASKRTYPLKSSFVPTYNMSVNLISMLGRDRAKSVLEQSFAQYQTDAGVVGVSRELARLTAQRDAMEAVSCHLGDFGEYARLREEISGIESTFSKARKATVAADFASSLAALMDGDVVWVRHHGWSVVLYASPATKNREAVANVMTVDHTFLSLRAGDLDVPLESAGRIRVPKKFSPKNRQSRKALVAALNAKASELGTKPRGDYHKPSVDEMTRQVAQLRQELKRHPCHQCEDREEHAVAMAAAMRVEREIAKLQRRSDKKSRSLGVRFESICQVLETLGYIVFDDVTELGSRLARVYNERDLVTSECIRQGVFDGLDAPALVAVLSSLVYEARHGQQGAKVRMPTAASEDAQSALRRVWRDVAAHERAASLPPSAAPDIGFAEAAWRWCAGHDLATVLRLADQPAGDFVRWMRQVIDLTGQVGAASGPGPLAQTCREAIKSMKRGVVIDDV